MSNGEGDSKYILSQYYSQKDSKCSNTVTNTILLSNNICNGYSESIECINGDAYLGAWENSDCTGTVSRIKSIKCNAPGNSKAFSLFCTNNIQIPFDNAIVSIVSPSCENVIPNFNYILSTTTNYCDDYISGESVSYSCNETAITYNDYSDTTCSNLQHSGIEDKVGVCEVENNNIAVTNLCI